MQIWPAELVPFRQVGRLTLNATTANAFNEDAQLTFSPAHLVPGVDVSADRLLQLRCAPALLHCLLDTPPTWWHDTLR